MKVLRELLNNKIGIIFVIVHWILLTFALAKVIVSLAYTRDSDLTWEFILAVIFIVSDLPAIIPAAILWSPFYVFVEDKTVFLYGAFFTSIITITFQWLFIGQSIYNTFSPIESKLTSLSLTDE